MAEMTEDRYGPWMGAIYTLFALSFFTINTAAMLKGAAKVINQATGGELGVNVVVLGMTAIFILYSFVGGLVASAWTDFFQGFLIIALSFMLVPLGLAAVGGMDGIPLVTELLSWSLADDDTLLGQQAPEVEWLENASLRRGFNQVLVSI